MKLSKSEVDKKAPHPNLGLGMGTRHQRSSFKVFALAGLMTVAFCGHLLRSGGISLTGLFKDFKSQEKYIVGSFDWKQVPMDHTDPHGEKVAVAMKRVNAGVPRGSKKYRGPILFNPGNFPQIPVDSIHEARNYTNGSSAQMMALMSLTGIGETTPTVNIFSDEFERAPWENSAPFVLIGEHPDVLDELYARSVLTGKLASARSKHVAEYVSTAMVARDMLAITRAHGYEKLKYWGFSYGTILGATITYLIGCIQGVVEFSDYMGGYWFTNLIDTDKILTYFTTQCVASGPSCPLHAPTPALVSSRIQNIYNTIQATPLPVLGSNSTFGIISSGVLKSLWFRALYNPFTSLKAFMLAMAALEKGDGRPILDLHLQAKGKMQPTCPSNSTSAASMPVQEAGHAVMCGEGLNATRTLEAFMNYTEELGKLSVFNDVWAQTTRLPCLFVFLCYSVSETVDTYDFPSGWEITAKEIFTGPFTGNTSFPLLIIGNTMGNRLIPSFYA
ncbi:hypothetical protein BU17DRAFT_65692 [Hysterangium stoloniferum]|nr:hypothetical protein BU17DRAFT_65692 [Hysterangium stoloniferum]